ncbi:MULTISPECIES: hypothetical protein [unclassified Rathayibacter]|uniref:hypothetical protein n=1 Tax=unclassified Rathayibacter TaxID=2609250 RepID=UPI000CE7E0D7|nr:MULTISPECIES: hypothetical protein [unclassified Rathayibacter]PPF25749.1 hypothetical protein C5C54_14710 [Rathayibacter sp. AY1F2]PPH43694.1 hypothetical protein C5C42_13440 [Rathayibacter sp. AY1F7]
MTDRYPLPENFRHQDVAVIDLWDQSLELLNAQADVQIAAANGDIAATNDAGRTLIRIATAFAWPTAVTADWKRMTGIYAGHWALWRILDADGNVLREWEDEPGDMTDESKRELVALDLISNRSETQAFGDAFEHDPASVARGYGSLAI